MKKFKDFWAKSTKNKIIVVVSILFIIGVFGSMSETTNIDQNSNVNNDINNNVNTNINKNVIDEKIIVEVENLTSKTAAEIDLWCEEKKVNCNYIEDYSDNIAPGEIISQSVVSGRKIYEGDTINIVYSLGKKPSTEYSNALKKAESYSKTMHMSKTGIYDQLTSEYGEQFPADAAQYAIDNMTADWNANALAKAKSYNQTMNMSKAAIYDQLISEYGEQFTKEEAQYAIDNITADWNASALAKAKSYQQTMNMSKAAIYDQLISKYGEQFTKEEAQYAIDHLDD